MAVDRDIILKSCCSCGENRSGRRYIKGSSNLNVPLRLRLAGSHWQCPRPESNYKVTFLLGRTFTRAVGALKGVNQQEGSALPVAMT